MESNPRRTPTKRIEDHFSAHASLYAATRPDYPDALFRHLAAMSPARERAWDCATGSGQAARSLARYFEGVTATDASFQQVRQAHWDSRIRYHVAAAEASAISDASIDLVVVAQALHWFDIVGFLQEVRRVLRKDGILAAWCYSRMRIHPGIDACVTAFYRDTVGPYWPAERRHVERGYLDLDLPLVDEPVPSLHIEKRWNLLSLAEYVRSWSATQRYIRDVGVDPVHELIAQLRPVWGTQTVRRRVVWPLAVRAGRLR